jgi:hypothetical protein
MGVRYRPPLPYTCCLTPAWRELLPAARTDAGLTGTGRGEVVNTAVPASTELLQLVTGT